MRPIPPRPLVYPTDARIDHRPRGALSSSSRRVWPCSTSVPGDVVRCGGGICCRRAWVLTRPQRASGRQGRQRCPVPLASKVCVQVPVAYQTYRAALSRFLGFWRWAGRPHWDAGRARPWPPGVAVALRPPSGRPWARSQCALWPHHGVRCGALRPQHGAAQRALGPRVLGICRCRRCDPAMAAAPPPRGLAGGKRYARAGIIEACGHALRLARRRLKTQSQFFRTTLLGGSRLALSFRHPSENIMKS